MSIYLSIYTYICMYIFMYIYTYICRANPESGHVVLLQVRLHL